MDTINIDFEILYSICNRFECKSMWGGVVPVLQILNQEGGEYYRDMVQNEDHDAFVDKVARDKGIFDGCIWKEFISSRYMQLNKYI